MGGEGLLHWERRYCFFCFFQRWGAGGMMFFFPSSLVASKEGHECKKCQCDLYTFALVFFLAFESFGCELGKR
jgi:hypothetical protein